ncbi:purine-nucleoside phosphorylase [Ruminococcus sp.]|uniref:purine-nucleoside phosphorylase n=1 Tax=Ruminococcus sp. TaxID=41978 RepID=UPI0025E2075A|nr:purine-nucleoside phosphorylase [Ruminococcus sp.]MBQ8966181.1 purine-nucleoside phosphorylase [Ruminococcus sp.]
MTEMTEKLNRAAEYIKAHAGLVPEVGIVLGSGLGDLADRAEVSSIVDYADIPEFPRSTAEGHKGRFVFGRIGGTPVVIMQGRVHYYEGYDMQQVIMPTRVMALIGVKTLLLTNASGGIDRSFGAGDLMLLTDHIAAFVPNPLIGKNPDELGTRFPDMSEVYDLGLREKSLAAADKLGIELRQGVYCQLTGPSYETPAEVRMLDMLGADAVGMSTAVEAIAARHMGLKVCGVSVVTNPASGISETPLDHEEVKVQAAAAAVRLGQLLEELIKNI